MSNLIKTNTPITFKKIQTTDILVMVNMMETFYAIDGYPMDRVITTENFHHFINTPQLGQAFLIQYNDQNVGYIIMNFLFSFEFSGTIAFLDELFIDEGLRGKGIGKASIKFIKEFAKQQELKSVFLEVELHNMKAQELYKKSGWKNHHRSLMIYKVE